MSPEKRAILDAPGTLLVLAGTSEPDGPELHVRVAADGGVTAFCGHVDLGTGIRTALAQIVAEELDVAFARVAMVLGHTGLAPDQGPTIASNTIQVTSQPLRAAAAQARHYLVGAAAATLEVAVAELQVDDGLVRHAPSNKSIDYGALVAGRQIRLELDATTPVKAVADHRIVGRSVPRADIPAKATGAFTYVHDVRLPGMLHGRVVRPPYSGRDSGAAVGRSLLGVDDGSVAHIAGVIAIVVEQDFVGVVAEREEQAVAAADALVVAWRPPEALPALYDVEAALRNNPSHRRVLKDTGDVDMALAAAATRLTHTYVWPYQMHASIGPSCAVADVSDGGLTVWSGTQNPHVLRADLARLLDLPETAVTVNRMEASGCYGRNGADDVAGDAALLARKVGRPVRVQLTRAQEHLWEPKGAGQIMDVDGGLDAAGHLAAYDFATRYPSNGAPLLALLLTGKIAPAPVILPMGDRTAIPPYSYPALRVIAHDMPPIVRASWLRGVSALPNTFAHESFVDELAVAAGEDPVAFRLRHLPEQRAASLVAQTAARAGWEPRTGPRRRGEGDIRHGQGFAYALYVHSQFPGYGAAWSAWVADVTVNTATGEVAVTRVTVGQDSGLMINPAGVTHQIHGNVIQATSRVLKEEVRFDSFGVVPREWGGYPLLTFPEVPDIDVLLVPQPNEPPLGSGESASVPSAAAIANAIFDATGVRFRAPPFTPERIRAGLAPPPDAKGSRRRAPRWAFLRRSAFVAAAIGLASAAWPWRTVIAPTPLPDPGLFSATAIERGRVLAALGNCAVCHTAAGGAVNAGGLALDTPFGRIFSTNITPDVETGIGAWSYPAFARAMREGLHRDGRRLYPAFPYTSYTRTSEDDLQALYAFLMTQPAVSAPAPRNALRFPFNLRPLLAGWNALFLRLGAFVPDAARSARWNRGAYLVESLGHCGACHSPRNVLGAEKGGTARLTGGFAEGWEAPALTQVSRAPVAWDEDELFLYLRMGTTRFHGVAAGPMAPIVADLRHVPDDDVRAMAHYLATFSTGVATPGDLAADMIARTAVEPRGFEAGARIFAGACAACHTPTATLTAPAPPPLALDTNLHAQTPDNLLRILLDGSAAPVSGAPTGMPSFANSLDDRQLADLIAYLRARFAPDAPAWPSLEEAAKRARAS